MDTITHGIAGALIGKAVFRGEDLFAPHAMSRGRIITWALMLGAIFPDSDTLRDIFSTNPLLMITWHRSITHSLVLLPIWAALLALITSWFARSRKWEAPSFVALTGIYAVGILSHILLDLVTTFGTMIWSPLEWSRPAWDLVFIVDFTFTAILLVPQLLAWVYAEPEKMRPRAIGIWLVFLPAPIAIARIAQIVGAPISNRTILAAMMIFTAIFLLPALRGLGLKIRHDSWNRAGFIAALAFLGATLFAHHAALLRVKRFASLYHLDVQSFGALPFPPSLWRWDGLIRTTRGVYELRMDLAGKTPNDETLMTAEHTYYPDAFANDYIEAAKRLPEVQKVLWFDRFPVTQFHKEGAQATVEIFDLRFPKIQPGRPAPFTYRVRMDEQGNVLSQGWEVK